MTNLERIEEIKKLLGSRKERSLGDAVDVRVADDLLKAFEVMRELYIEALLIGSICDHKKEANDWMEREFEEKMGGGGE